MPITEKASNIAHEAVDKVTNAAHEAEHVIHEKGAQLKHAEEEMVENCRSYVRDNPITSLGIAAAAGFLLSRLLSGR